VVLGGTCPDAARALIGVRLVRDDAGGDRRIGRIVEVEAYVGTEDQASHARFGPTDRNRVMFGPPGIAYVYLVYGMHDCLNVVAEPAGRAAAILIRAVEPLEGIPAMRRARLEAARRRARRSRAEDEDAARIDALPAAHLARGPGLTAAAFGIVRADTGLDLCDPSSPIRLESAETGSTRAVVATPRVGIAYAGEPWISRPWRFLDPRSAAVSGPAAKR